jgi:protein-S-isoprenylcysteine O-methyltransferase Ste14
MMVLLGLECSLSFLFPATLTLGFVEKGIGWLIFISGISLLAVAASLFRSKGTTVNPTKEPDKLVTEGIYRRTRNPMYLGMLLILTGLPFVVGSLIGLIFPVIFFFYMDRVVIPKEEAMVENVFGALYQKYKSQTRRWI